MTPQPDPQPSTGRPPAGDGLPPGPGLLALVILPSGEAGLTRLPEQAPRAAQAIHDLIGGWLEGITPAGADWCAYINEEGKGMGLAFNPQADAMVRALGFPFNQGDFLVGPVVFLGRQGVNETDVPEHILTLARTAGCQL